MWGGGGEKGGMASWLMTCHPQDSSPCNIPSLQDSILSSTPHLDGNTLLSTPDLQVNISILILKMEKLSLREEESRPRSTYL